MNKIALRQKYSALRANLSDHEIDEMSLQIANQMIQLDIWQHSFYQNPNRGNTYYSSNSATGK